MNLKNARGFSVIEVLIASAIFLIIAIGILPLFVRAMTSNTVGNDYMNAANHGRSGLEALLQTTFDSTNLTPDAGQALKTTTDYWVQTDNKSGPEKMGDELWVATPVAATNGNTLWTRTTTVRQYSVNSLEDLNLQTTEAQPGGTDPIFIHLKEVRVRLEGGRSGGGFGGAKTVTLRVLKAF